MTRATVPMLIVAVTAAGGFVTGRISAPRASGGPARGVQTSVERRETTVNLGALRDDLHELIVAELRAAAPARAAACPGAERAPVATAPPPPTDAEAAAREQARSLIDAAVTAGRWTRDDAAELASLLPALDEEARRGALRTLVPALNDGHLALDPGVTKPF